jgi:hypothetical protein
MPFQESIASRSDLPKAQRQTKQAIEQVHALVEELSALQAKARNTRSGGRA